MNLEKNVFVFVQFDMTDWGRCRDLAKKKETLYICCCCYASSLTCDAAAFAALPRLREL